MWDYFGNWKGVCIRDRWIILYFKKSSGFRNLFKILFCAYTTAKETVRSWSFDYVHINLDTWIIEKISSHGTEFSPVLCHGHVVNTVAKFFFFCICVGVSFFRQRLHVLKLLAAMCSVLSPHGYLYMLVYIDSIVFNVYTVSPQAFRLFPVVTVF